MAERVTAEGCEAEISTAQGEMTCSLNFSVSLISTTEHSELCDTNSL